MDLGETRVSGIADSTQWQTHGAQYYEAGSFWGVMLCMVFISFLVVLH